MSDDVAQRSVNRRGVLKKIGVSAGTLSIATGIGSAEGNISDCPDPSTDTYSEGAYSEGMYPGAGDIQWSAETGLGFEIYGPEPATSTYRDDKWRYQCRLSSTSQAYSRSNQDNKLDMDVYQPISFGVSEDNGDVELRFKDDNDDYYGGWNATRDNENGGSGLRVGMTSVVGAGISAMGSALSVGTPQTIAANLLLSAVSNVDMSAPIADNSRKVTFQWNHAKEVSGNVYFDIYLNPGQTTKVSVKTVPNMEYRGSPTTSSLYSLIETPEITASEEAPSNCEGNPPYTD